MSNGYENMSLLLEINGGVPVTPRTPSAEPENNWLDSSFTPASWQRKQARIPFKITNTGATDWTLPFAAVGSRLMQLKFSQAIRDTFRVVIMDTDEMPVKEFHINTPVPFVDLGQDRFRIAAGQSVQVLDPLGAIDVTGLMQGQDYIMFVQFLPGFSVGAGLFTGIRRVGFNFRHGMELE